MCYVKCTVRVILHFYTSNMVGFIQMPADALNVLDETPDNEPPDDSSSNGSSFHLTPEPSRNRPLKVEPPQRKDGHGGLRYFFTPVIYMLLTR